MSTSFNGKTTAHDVLNGVSLVGKRVVITGANSGIGFAAARSMAERGAALILACRSEQKAAEACSAIQAAHPDSQVESRPLDLASFASIEHFATQLGPECIDVLVCNAGVFNMRYAETRDGFESTVGVCHYGHAYLVQLLMPRLLAATEPRVVMVSSESHRQTRTLNFDQFPMTETKYFGNTAYAQAKLCNALFAAELHRRYADKGLLALSLHPGNLVTTGFGDDHALTRFLFKIASPFTKSPEQGAASIAFCAAHPEAKSLGGRYIVDCKPKKTSKAAAGEELSGRLWRHTVETIAVVSEAS